MDSDGQLTFDDIDYILTEESKLCECGCGEPTNKAVQTNSSRGIVKDQQSRFVKGHTHKGQKGEDSAAFKGGRTKNLGYVFILVDESHPYFRMAHQRGNSWYIPEHRLVMAEALSRPLSDTEIVHHENEVRDDNRIENLTLFTSNQAHLNYHADKRKAANGS